MCPEVLGEGLVAGVALRTIGCHVCFVGAGGAFMHHFTSAADFATDSMYRVLEFGLTEMFRHTVNDLG
ncbi:MAG: hypothetical protein MJZ79_04710 [Paludibacteraceae bacterium]|nr:hypothetical protein [Paludibacteraceae bacterium]